EFEHDIGTIALEYEPRTRSIYSDLGFILLGFLVADRGRATLDELFRRIVVRLKPGTTDSDREHDSSRARLQPDLLTFAVPPEARRLAAPTRPMDGDSRRRRRLGGAV